MSIWCALLRSIFKVGGWISGDWQRLLLCPDVWQLGFWEEQKYENIYWTASLSSSDLKFRHIPDHLPRARGAGQQPINPSLTNENNWDIDHHLTICELETLGLFPQSPDRWADGGLSIVDFRKIEEEKKVVGGSILTKRGGWYLWTPGAFL